MPAKWSRYGLILSIALLTQAALYYGTSRSENVPEVKPLQDFATQFPGWYMTEQGYVDAETQAVLRADDTMSRTYASSKYNLRPTLFVAFFKTQRTGKAPHSPKNCLPGSGWEMSSTDYMKVDVPGLTQPIEINRYIVSKGAQKSVVLYWYQTQRRVVASEYEAKILTVADAIRYNRTDTALVRVVVPVPENGDEAGAAKIATEFVQSLFKPLRDYLPS
jgi:EpsI family protein